jgi:glycosyltransferase involved in cell wall biosynthesis
MAINTTDDADRTSGLRLAYVSTESIDDHYSLSGTTRAIGLALEGVCGQVHYVSPLAQRLSLIDRLANACARRLGTRSRLTLHRWRNARAVAQRAKVELADLAVDCLFAPSCIPIAALDDSRPMYLYSDATVPGLCGYYGEWKNVHSKSYREAMSVEREALSRCRKVFFASEWARKSAIAAYDLEPSSVIVVPRGAIVETPPSTDEILGALASRQINAPRLLVVGRDWHRKGMDVACAVLDILRSCGVAATLTLVGGVPPRNFTLPPHAAIVPFLPRSSALARSRLRQLFMDATIFLFPTRAEAMGIVLAEAAAFGIPAVARDTGGTSAAVVHKSTGILVPEGGGPEAFAQAVTEAIASRNEYERLALNAVARFRSVLNWQAVASRLVREIIQL